MVNVNKNMSVKEAAQLLGIKRSTLYGHLSDFETLLGDDINTHTIVGGKKVITPENFEELKWMLAHKKTILGSSGTGRPIAGKAVSSAKKYERALKYARSLKES